MFLEKLVKQCVKQGFKCQNLVSFTKKWGILTAAQDD